VYPVDIITKDSLTETGISRYSIVKCEEDMILSVPPTDAVVLPDSRSDGIKHVNPSAANNERQYEGHCSFICREPP
jgi:hypothetical protein